MESNYLKTSYILVAVKNKEDLKSLLDDLKEYIIVKRNNISKIDIKHHLNNFTTYITTKYGYTKILSDYWKKDKIYVKCVTSHSNIISDNNISEKLNAIGYIDYGFIVDTNYQERILIRNNQLIANN